MTVPTTTSSHSPALPAGKVDWLDRLLVANLVLQMVIIVTGGLVRLTGSGLGCPTWPQCVPGSFTPTVQQEQGYHKLIEFGNRLLTFVLAAVALAVIVVAAKQLRGTRPRLYRWTWVPLLGIVAQAIVGGIVVLAKLDPRTVSPHFLLSIALVGVSAWLLYRYREGDGPVALTVPPAAHRLVHVTAAVGGVVLFLGTVVTGSGPHSGDSLSEVRFGFDPRATAWLHADAVMLFTGLVVACVVVGLVAHAPAAFSRAWRWVLLICIAQGVIGYGQYFTALPIALVLVHLAGSALLTAALAWAVMTSRTRPLPLLAKTHL